MRKLVASFDPELTVRDGRLILRRYLDLPKLVDLLRTGELYLRQASRFDDLLEGTLPEQLRRGASDVIGDVSVFEQKNRDQTYLSCWTLGTKDNMALWKLYGVSAESVAITTTVKRLTTVAPGWAEHGSIDVRKVRYINYAGRRLPNGVYGLGKDLFRLKHVAYSFEKEVRVVLTRSTKMGRDTTPSAIRVPVNLDRFLRSIVVGPEADNWFFDLVVDVARKYNITAPVRRSELTHLLNRAKASQK